MAASTADRLLKTTLRGLASFSLASLVFLSVGTIAQAQHRGDTAGALDETRSEARCCLCQKLNQQSFCSRATGILSCDQFRASAGFEDIPQADRALLDGYTCGDVSDARCQPTSAQAQSGLCPAAPYPNFGEAARALSPVAATVPEAASTFRPQPFQSITPQLGTQIPGLVFSPARKDGDVVYVPFLAQYISAVFRYAVGISVVVTIIMVVYGGFLYLMGSIPAQIQSGRQAIVDAIMGLLLLLGGYLLLNVINPTTLNLPTIKLGYIKPSYYGEGEGANERVRVTNATACRCSPLVDGINPQSVLKVPCFRQYGSAWGDERYGTNLLNGASSNCTGLDSSPNLPACSSSASQSADCIGTFQQGACGVTSLAVVLGYYGAQVDGHPVTPLDTGKYAVHACLRPHNGGTRAICSAEFETTFPGFTCESGGQTAQAAAAAIRTGFPVIFHCAQCTVTKGDGTSGSGSSGAGHYMVLTGVSEDGHLFSIHDVGHEGNGAAVAITADEINGPRVGLTYVKPRAGATTPGTANARCTERSSTPRTSQGVERVSFTYCPGGACTNGWDANEASLIFPTRLRSETHPAVRLYIYIHGLNGSGSTSGQARYIALLTRALQTANPAKNIVVATPHFMRGNPGFMRSFNLEEFYRTARTALSGALPGSTIRDTAIGGHSAATCQGQLNQALSASIENKRGYIVYDGCASDDSPSINAGNFSPHGQPLYINPDLVGMGIDDDYTDLRTHTRPRHRETLIRSSWGLTGPVTCPPQVPAGVTCYKHPTEEWWSFETSVGHPDSVGIMTSIAFGALYGP